MAAQLSNARGALVSIAGKVRSAVAPAAQLVEKEVGSRYAKLIEANKEYVVKDQAKADQLLKQWYYTKLASIPDGIAHAKSEVGVLQKKWTQRGDLPLTEVATYALFAGELYAWFVVGEIVGRGFTLVDYDV